MTAELFTVLLMMDGTILRLCCEEDAGVIGMVDADVMTNPLANDMDWVRAPDLLFSAAERWVGAHQDDIRHGRENSSPGWAPVLWAKGEPADA